MHHSFFLIKKVQEKVHQHNTLSNKMQLIDKDSINYLLYPSIITHDGVKNSIVRKVPKKVVESIKKKKKVVESTKKGS